MISSRHAQARNSAQEIARKHHHILTRRHLVAGPDMRVQDDRGDCGETGTDEVGPDVDRFVVEVCQAGEGFAVAV